MSVRLLVATAPGTPARIVQWAAGPVPRRGVQDIQLPGVLVTLASDGALHAVPGRGQRTLRVSGREWQHGAGTAAGLRIRLQAAQRLVKQQDDWEKDRAQLRQIAAELAVANRRLANVALTDLLTGLPNRRSAMDQLDQAWSAASRSGLPLSVMVVDIDHFKQINDTQGHAAGDMVLREAAATLRASARREDSVCRIGSEEFLVVCPNTDLKSAMLSAERLRASLCARRIAIGQTEKTITVSIGVAMRRPGTADIDALVSSADQALYAAKEVGRNCTCDKRQSPSH